MESMNMFAAAAIILFGIGFGVALLQQNLLRKLVGFNICEAAACWLLAALAPGGTQVAVRRMILLGIIAAAALTAFSLALIWQAYRHFGTIQLRELLKRMREEEA